MRSRGLLLVVPLAWVACFSQSSGGSPQVDFDASFDASFDGSTEDSEAPEATVDAPVEASTVVDSAVVDVVEAGPPAVTVVVGGAAGFESGVPVVFTDATGATVYSNMTTNAAGQASFAFPSGGGAATVILGTPSYPAIYTYLGLTPGQTVLVVDQASLTALFSETAPTANLATVPAAPTFDGGIANYTMQAGSCQSSSQSLPLDVSLLPHGSGAPCIGLGPVGASFGAVFPALVQAEDGVGNLLGFAGSKNNPLATGADAGLSNVTLPATWSTTTTQQFVAVSNVPDGGTPPSVTYSEVADGIFNTLQPSAPSIDAGAPPEALAVVTTHPGFPDAVQAESQVVRYTSGESVYAVVQRAASPTADGTITLDQTPVGTAPAITGATTTATAQPTVSWTLASGSGNFGSATGIVSLVNWSAMTADGGFQSGNWTIVSPGTTVNAVQVPALPPMFSDYAPAAGASAFLNDLYAVYGETAVPDYASLLSIASLFPQNGCSFSTPMAPPLPFPGTAFILAFAPQIQC